MWPPEVTAHPWFIPVLLVLVVVAFLTTRIVASLLVILSLVAVAVVVFGIPLHAFIPFTP